ncbi:hypothetical protein [Nitratireductor sp. OM-1]|uniref:hypothetical protein n=1 Tax=Nitratireductor sp. OM-1 TaxID=1756988 RepID=UPI000DE16EFA|nr:hypothetical protein [Nitratireductor sp. OM-1]
MRKFKPRHLSEVVVYTSDGLIRFNDIQPWYLLGAHCARCKMIAELDRAALERRFGKDAVTYELSKRLVCRSCQNRRGNTFLVVDQRQR